MATIGGDADLIVDQKGAETEGETNSSTSDPSQTDQAAEPLGLQDAPAVRSKTRLFFILTGLYNALFFAALNQTIVSTAIPTIASELHSGAGYTWIGGAYLLANAASAPIWAKLSDIWGRKPILLGAVALFFVSSIICATSVSMTMLIAARALQGTAGGGIFQLVIIVISDLFSVRRRTIFFGFLEVMWALASGVGPILGGVFAQGPGWQWIWWINLPLSGLTFVLLAVFLDVHNPRTRIGEGLKALDWAGTLSILGVTLMLLLGLEFGGEAFSWDSPTVICLIVFGSLMSLVFIWSEKKLAKYPLMPPAIFNNRSNIACLAVDFIHAFMFIAPEYYLPLYLQAVQEASPIRSGVLILPLVVMASISGIVTALLMHWTGRYRGLIWTGIVLITLGTGLYILLDADSSVGVTVGLQFISGTGAGLLFQPPMIALQANVHPDDVATATATFGFLRELASAISIVLGGVIFQNGMKTRAPSLRAAGASPSQVDRFSGAEAAANTLLVKSIENDVVRRAVEEAYAYAVRNMWILYASVGAVGVVVSVFISRKALSKDHTETKTGLKSTKERVENDTIR